MNTAAVLSVLVTGFVIWLTQGRVNPASPGNGELGLLLLGGLSFFFPFLYNKKIDRHFSRIFFSGLLLLIPILTSLLNDNLLYPNLAQQNQGIQFLGPLRTIPANIYNLFQIFLWCSAIYWIFLYLSIAIHKHQSQNAILAGVMLGVVNLALVLAVVPFPWIDVFTSNTTAVVKLLEGENPYASKYIDLYAGQQGYAPSFGYLPGYFLVGVPALVFGDVRLASLVAVLAISLWIMQSPGKTPEIFLKKAAFIGCVFFGGSAFYILEQAWIDPILAACFLFAGICLKGDHLKTAGFFLGWAASIKQYGFIGAGFFIFFVLSVRGKEKAGLVLISSILTSLFIIIPFLVWNPEAFFNSTVSGIKNLPTRVDSLSIRSLLYAKTGSDYPWISWFAPSFVILLLGWKSRFKVPSIASAFFFSGLTYLTIFLFSPHAFANYYYFVFLLFLCGLTFSEEDKQENISNQAVKTRPSRA